ncbi:hypothetical protein WICPIJ_006251 [Wickerhamomyces pijperi]|uniref:Uncharacterized protein n=1 Tax=Wickerhamomyces pijperi TaxID=599730 RepID=A0A9P8Q2L5_WICPI|nr:hypothetical protein WICPIJ_006251 [Wickerhamomyces pijperi]
MSIRLPIDDEESQLGSFRESEPATIPGHQQPNNNITPTHQQSPAYQVISFLAQYKFQRIPYLNWSTIVIFLYMISKLISRYESMYADSKLLTTIIANSLLYGLSDSLAQSIFCYTANITGRGSQMERFNSIGSINLDSLNDSEAMFTDYGDTSSVHRGSHGGNKDGSQYQLLSNQMDADIFNFRRFFGFICWGFFMAFIQVGWYWVLNHFYNKEPTLVSVLERVLTDQLLFSPISLFSFFSYSNFVLEGGDKFTLHQKIQRIYLSTLAFNYMVWPLVQFINFLVMPKKFQVPFSSSSTLVSTPQQRPSEIDEILSTLKRYDAAVIKDLEDYLLQQYTADFSDLNSNLALLKLYELGDEVTVEREEATFKILIKGLVEFVDQDFSLYLHLLPPSILSSESEYSIKVQNLISLYELLITNKFDQFLTKNKEFGSPVDAHNLALIEKTFQTNKGAKFIYTNTATEEITANKLSKVVASLMQK